MFKSLLLKGRMLCILLVCLVSSLAVTAQTKITGKVIGSDDKLPVAGASVRVRGTNVGTVTDVSGIFTITAKTGDVLSISFIGYQTKEVPVTGGALGTITLASASSTLNEVVVTGYTAQRKKDIAGAVATVDVSDAKKIPSTSSEQLLQGQAAGVTVINQGAPGANSTVFVRGVSNFGNTSPLYVIDGVQATSMSQVNPNDIESISVLKDAGAAAIYGVAGGNGVIVVTTKKGKSGKSTISYDGYYGTQVPPGGNVWHLMSPTQQSQIAFAAGDPLATGLYGTAGNIYTYAFQGPAGVGSFPASGVTNDSAIEQYYHFDAANPGNDFLVMKFNKAGTDWFHEIFKSAPEQMHTVTASGGSDKSTYLFSLNYLNQQGTLIDTYEKRYAVRLNTTFSAANNHIRIGEAGSVTYRENNGGYGGSQQQEGGSISYTYREMPVIPVYDIAGNYAGGYEDGKGEPLGNGSNPVAVQQRTADNHAHFVIVQGNLFAEADITKHLMAKTSFGGTLFNQYYWGLSYNTYENEESHASANGNNENEQMSSAYNWTNLLQYKQVFGKHNIQAIAGYEQRYTAGREFHAQSQNLFSLDPAFAQLQYGQAVVAPYSYVYQPTGTKSLFAKVTYQYNDKYILDATIRRDGYSDFYPGRQWGTFPAVSLAWRINQEDFMKGISWINDLKLRGSYGLAGNNSNITGSSAYTTYSPGAGSASYPIGGASTGAGSLASGYYQSQIGNAKTSWETDKITNIGIDASLFNHFDFTVEWYKKYISGLLFQLPLPATVGGANYPTINIGDVQNKGVDVSLTYHDKRGDFAYSITGTLTSYKNNIVSEGSGTYFDAGASRDNDIVRDEVGHPIGAFFGYKVTGIYQNQDQVNSLPGYGANAKVGSFIYQDTNHDGKIDATDRTWIGNPNPDFTYGVNLNASYKGFDFSMVLYGSYGNQDFNYTKYWTDFYNPFPGGKSLALYNNSAKVVNGVVTNPSATLPAASAVSGMGSNTISSYYVESGSFLKCRVMQIGYTISPNILKTIGIDRLHIYGQVTNLFTITKYDGLDPELVPSLNVNGSTTNASAAYGIDYGAYPNNQRQYILGVNLSF